ncbi:DUF2147 domain-containing protein [Flavicella marina]|uniref:hypothetical protein n=1 Tax=Flavicella marina TaxID=1475951 RepID=UPI001264DE14|nr:hypothetical protein [Flavicella marina]
MKITLRAIAFCVTILLISCNASTVTPGVYPIVGTWKYTSDGGSITITRSFSEDLSYTYHGVNNNDPLLNVTIIGTYKSDGTNLSFTYSNGETDSGKYSSTDRELYLTMANENGPTVYIKQ